MKLSRYERKNEIDKPEHLPRLVVSETSVGTVHNDHKLDPRVRHVAKHLLMLARVQRAKVKLPLIRTSSFVTCREFFLNHVKTCV